MAKILGVDFAPLNVPMKRRLQTAIVFHWMSTFLFMGFGSLFLMIALFFTRFWWVACLYFSWLAYDIKTCKQGGRRSEWFRRWRAWEHYRDYFPVSLEKTAELLPDQNYLLGFHPHGIIACGGFCNFATDATGFSRVFPGITPRLLTLNGLFLFPIFRDYFQWTGMCDASKESIEWIFTNEGVGNAAVLVVGGAREALDAHPNTYNAFIKRRKGFVRLALKHGAHLVPVYSFGENDAFVQVPNPPGSLLRNVQEFLVGKLGNSTPLFHGRGMFNYTFGILPYRRRIHTVVGAPIPVEKTEQPTAEEVDALHQTYVDQLVQLFDAHKGAFGLASNVTLNIV